MVQQYVKKPIPVDAIKITEDNIQDIVLWSQGAVRWDAEHSRMVINTWEGIVWAGFGDYIIRGIRGEFYPHNGALFEEVYEPVTSENPNA